MRARFRGHLARHISPDDVEQFLDDLEEGGLGPTSINHFRTILNNTFNFAIKRGRYDQNPVSAVPQRQEPPGRDRFVEPEELRAILDKVEDD